MELFCNKCHTPNVTVKEGLVSPVVLDSECESLYTGACAVCDEDLMSIEIYYFTKENGLNEHKGFLELIAECQEAGYSVEQSTLKCTLDGIALFAGKTLGQAWVYCYEHLNAGGDVNTVELIKYYESEFQKTLLSHGSKSHYTDNAFFKLKGAMMGKSIKDICLYATNEVQRLNEEALNSL